MISKLKNYKKEIVAFALWFPFLFAININLSDIFYLGGDLIANINALRIILYLFSFLFLIFLFFINFKKIKLSNSIFFIYLLIFIIQSSFFFSENFNQHIISNFNIFFSGNIHLITMHTSNKDLGLEIQSIYMMIGSIGALIYFIIFNNKKYDTTIKIQIFATSLIIALVYLYFTTSMMAEYFKNEDVFLLYHSKYLINGAFAGHEMSRSTGISRILVMISIITLLSLFRFQNNYLRIFGFLFIISINSIIILLSSRFGIYSYIVVLLTLILFIKISYLKKIIIIICLTIVPYLLQNSIKEYKFYTQIKENILDKSLNEKNIVNNYIDKYIVAPIEIVTKSNSNYEKLRKSYIEEKNIATGRSLIKRDEKDNSLTINTTGRMDIWKKAYHLVLDDKINIWIGNGYQTDRKLLAGDKNYLFYGSNISNALLHIFICSGLIGVFIFMYINFKIAIRIFQFYFVEKIYLNYNANFLLIIATNIIFVLYLRCLVENSIAYYNIDFLIFLMCLYIVDKKRKII